MFVASQRLVIAALLVRLFDEWWSYLPAGIVEDLRRDLGVDYSQAAWVLSAAVLGGLVGGPLGALSDHVARRPLVACGVAIQVIGLAAFALGSPYPVLLAASFALGAASDLVLRPLESALAETTGDDLDRHLGRQHLFSFVGDSIAPVLLAIGAATALGWRGAFGVTAVAIGCFGVLAVAAEYPPPPGRSDEPSDDTASITVATLIRRRDIWMLALFEILIFPLDEPILGFAIARAAFGEAGSSAAWAQLLAGGYFVGGVAGSAWVARHGVRGTARRGAPWFLVVGAALTVAVGSLAGPLVGMVVVGIGMALFWAVLHHRLLTIVPERSATVSAIVSVIGSVGALIPVLAGDIADRRDLTIGLFVFVGAAVALALASEVSGLTSSPRSDVSAEAAAQEG